MHKRISIGIIVIALVGIGYYFLVSNNQYSKPLEKITIAAYAGDTGALVYIAKERGYFAENGLDVAIKDYEAGKLACDALMAGEADIATSADFVFVSNSFKNTDIRLLGTVAVAEVCELVARKDRGILEPQDLKGKRVGVTKKSTAEFFLGSFLIYNGLSISDIEAVDLKPSEIVEAVINGDIDAGYTWIPNTNDIVDALGENAVKYPGQSGQDFYFVLISKESWIESHPAAARRLMKALMQAEEYVKNNNQEAKKFIQKRFSLPFSHVDYSWLKHRFVVNISQALLIAIEDQARWRIENRLTDANEIPNYLDYIYMDALEEVKPEAISIIR